MRVHLVFAAAFLAAALPAAAQDHVQPGQSASSGSSAVLVRLETPLLAPVSFSRTQSSFASAPILPHDRSSLLGFSIEATETPFVQEVAVPVIAHPRGRFEVGGFYAVRPVENVLWGLPGAGSLPAWGVSSRSHAAVLAPFPDESYGFSLKIHFRGGDEPAPRPQSWRCAGKLVGMGRSCHIL